MCVIRNIAGIALFSLISSTFSIDASAQTAPAPAAGGGTTLRSWCQQQGNRQMCSQAKSDHAAAKAACQGQSGGQSNDACQQARAKVKTDMQALHQAGAPAPHRRSRSGGQQGGADAGDE